MAFNVLVVDDSDVIRGMIARTLDLARIPIGTLYEASNGREALDVLEDAWIDFVLADINMPVMNGEEMLEQMRLRPETADVPVIVVSSEGASERVSRLMVGGVTEWVRKPFTPEQIRDVIEVVTCTFPGIEEQHAHVDAVVGPVLETFAFVFPDAASLEDLEPPETEIVRATIVFNGAANGAMTMCAPSELCVQLAANILGIDPDDPDAHLLGADTLGEIANIAAGHLATRIEPDRRTDLHPPIVERMPHDQWEGIAASCATRAYLVEGHPLLVALGLRPAKVC